MLPTPLLLSIILSMPALSAALPVPAPAPSHLRIVERDEASSSTMTDFLKTDVWEPANVEDDSIYSAAAERNPDWDFIRRARAKRSAMPEIPEPSKKSKKAKKMKRSSSAMAKVANLDLINKAAVSASPSASSSGLATQITTESISVHKLESAAVATATSALASSATGREFSHSSVEGKNAQQTVDSVIASLSSAWATNASTSATASATSVATTSSTVTLSALSAAATDSASSDPYNGGETTSTGWEVLGEHVGTAMYMDAGVGACGEAFGDAHPIVALSHALFQSIEGATEDPALSPLCGKSVMIEYEGESVLAQVGDVHESAMSDIIVTRGVFEKLAPLTEGVLSNVTWSFS